MSFWPQVSHAGRHGPLPTVSAINYSLVDTSGGGLDVVLTGTNLDTVSSVMVGTTVATITSATPTKLTFTAPAKTAGTYDVTVNSPGGSASLTSAIEYWTPAQITGVNVYLDAGKAVTDSAGAVGAWVDQSSHAYNYTQATPANKPQKVANAFGALPGIQFTPEQWLSGTGFTNVTAWSYFAVAKWTSTDATPTNGGTAPTDYNVPLTIFGASGGWSAFGASAGSIAYSKYDKAPTTAGSGLNDGNPHLIGATGDAATNIKLYLGATQQGSTYTPGGTAATYNDRVGDGYLDSDGFNGTIGALITVTGVISSSDLAKLTKWAQQRFAAEAPVATSLNYTLVDTLGGGSDITITGKNLDTATSVTVGGTAATITANTATTVTFTAPAKAAGVYDVVVTTPGGSATLTSALEAWAPNSDPGCTLFCDAGGYNSSTGVWTARTGTSPTSPGTHVPASNGAPNFDGSGFLTTAAINTLIANAGGTFAVVTHPNTANNPEDVTPYNNAKQIFSKASSGPVGLYNATDGTTEWFTFYGFDDAAGAYKTVKRTVASLLNNKHAVVGTYSSAATMNVSADGSSFSAASTPLTGDLLYDGAPNDVVNLGAGYTSGIAHRGQLLAVVAYNVAKTDAFATKFYKWAQQRHMYQFDPASLTETGDWGNYVRYAGSPWTSSSSAGPSGGRTLSSATPPAIASLDGYPVASCNGTSTFLSEPTLAASSYFSASAYSIVMLVRAFGGAAPNANRYLDPQLFAQGSDLLGISWTTSGVSAWHYDGSNFNGTPFTACSAGAYHMVAVTFGGGTLACSVDNGPPATLAKSNVNNLGQTIAISRARAAGSYTYCQEDVARLLLFNTQLSASDLTKIYNNFKARYPSAGLP